MSHGAQKVIFKRWPTDLAVRVSLKAPVFPIVSEISLYKPEVSLSYNHCPEILLKKTLICKSSKRLSSLRTCMYDLNSKYEYI